VFFGASCGTKTLVRIFWISFLYTFRKNIAVSFFRSSLTLGWIEVASSPATLFAADGSVLSSRVKAEAELRWAIL